MRKVKTEDAVGLPLLHDITGILEGGFKGVVFRRNHIIQSEDISTLKNIGKDHVYVGELEANEVHEEDAAKLLAPHVVGENVSFNEPTEGKISLSSEVDGLLSINLDGLNKINSVGDYTIASLPNYMEVKKNQKLAGLRIVPLWTENETVDTAIEIAKLNTPIFSVKEYRKLKVGIIITGSEVYYGRIKDLFEPVLRKKLSKYDAEILDVKKCPDDLDFIKSSAQNFLDMGADLIIFTGGMSVDPDDLTPTVIKSLSDEMITQGVPMQPGNMLTIGKVGKAILIGVPGASIHAPTTSFEITLPKIFAGVEITKEDINAMGAGGLCLNCEVCHYPICFFGR
ncbi:MAG: molybdopterin-binding protein [Tissierellia bacterium]|nr:molybdopterin-binding protein [Tissierellia bacterium]